MISGKKSENGSLLNELKNNLNILKIDDSLPTDKLDKAEQQKLALYLSRNKEIKDIQQFICSDFLEKYDTNQIEILDCEKKEANKICQNLKKQLEDDVSSDALFKFLEKSYENIQELNDDDDEPSPLEKFFAKQFNLIQKVRIACVILDTTPLHCFICKGYVDYAKWLIKHGADIHVVNGFGHTPLEAAMRKRDFELVKLVDPTISFGNYECFLKKKDFLVSFGIFKFGLSESQAENYSFGLDEEGFKQIIPFLEKYLQEEDINKDEINQLRKIVDIFKQGREANRSTKKSTHLLDSKGILVGSTGLLGHVIGYIICKEEEKYVLTLIDKGILAYKSDGSPLHKNKNGKASNVFSLQVPKNEMSWLLTILKNANSCIKNEVSAQVFFFTTLPNKFGADWQFNTSLHTKEFKEGICFYSNIKTLLMCLFIKTYGDEETGYHKYKAFNLYMRKRSLEDYQSTVAEDDSLAIKGNEIILKKTRPK